MATDLELMQLFTDLTNLSGQKFSSEEDVNICYMNFIPLFKNSFGKYTLEEIRLAYQYAREGKFTNEKGEQFKLYRELNYASACDVMLEYEEFKKDKLGSFIQNQTLFLAENPNEPVNQIDAIGEFLSESWKITNRNEIDTLRGAFLYDYFKDLGLINLSKEEKTEIWKLALEMVKAEKEAEKLAKAPVKKQLTIWVDTFELPVTNVDNEVSKAIIEKFNAYKNWAKGEIEKL